MKKHLAKYKDKFGIEDTELLSDGSSLYLTLRGITFSGVDFELLEGLLDESKFEYEKYCDGSATLTKFELTVHLPIILINEGNDYTANLKAIVNVGNKKYLPVYLELDTTYSTFKVSNMDFEGALIAIQRLLPERTDIKTCLSCKHSNYHPLGNGMFGSLHCFKKVEDEKFSDKSELMHLWEKAVLEQKLFNVNEVHVCSEHQLVPKSDWTYKDYPP